MAVRLVKFFQLQQPHVMKHTLNDYVPEGLRSMLQPNDVVLLNEHGENRVPDVLRIPREHMTFDFSAYPCRIHFGEFTKHIADLARIERIPKCIKGVATGGARASYVNM